MPSLHASFLDRALPSASETGLPERIASIDGMSLPTAQGRGRAYGLGLSAALLVGVAAISGCSSTGASDDSGLFPVERTGATGPAPFDPDLVDDRRRSGEILKDLDKKMKIWTQLKLEGDEAQDRRTLKQIDVALRYEAGTKMALLIDQVETGPPYNRQRAAAALGFTNSHEAVVPLIKALDDAHPPVVSNALFGLSLLGSPKTPLARIARMMSDRTLAAEIRNNAGQTLNSFSYPKDRAAITNIEKGGVESLAFVPNIEEIELVRVAVRDAARLALGDELPEVRVHAAMLLARTGDAVSIPDIAALIGDQTPIVASAAARSIAFLGANDARSYGKAARTLVAALNDAERSNVRSTIERNLRLLSKRNYASYEDWFDWAARL